MSTVDKISLLLERQNKSQKELTDYLGISKNAFTDWKSGRIKSYTKHLAKIAEFLNVSVDYLLGNEEKPTNEGELSEKKRLFIQKVEGMTDSQLERLEQILALVENTTE